MTKRIFAVIFTVVMLLSVAAIPAGAAAEYGVKLDDAADLLTNEEEAALLSVIADTSARCKCNLAFVTVNDLNGASFSHYGTTQDYADMYYETYYGQNTDGMVVLLTLSNEYGKREIYISTSGKCIKRLSDAEREAIFDNVLEYHNPDSRGYYDFFNAIALDLQKDVPPHVPLHMALVALLVGFGVAMVVMLILRSQLKSVKMQRGAISYVRPGSMRVTQSRDTYLYSTVSRTARPKESSGGSSSHTSSGGGSHGGGGRSF